MIRKMKVIVLSAMGYWLICFLILKLFQPVNATPRFLEILPFVSIAPFFLGFLVSLIIKDTKGGLYGSICYLIYFIWNFIFHWIFGLHFKGFVDHFLNTINVYLYIGLISTISAAFGGIFADYVQRKRREKGRKGV